MRRFFPSIHPQGLPSPSRSPDTRRWKLRIGRLRVHQHSDHAHPFGLLRAHGERCERCSAAHKRDEFAPLHTPSLGHAHSEGYTLAGREPLVCEIGRPTDVRFGSNADFNTQISMSALPPKADIRRETMSTRSNYCGQALNRVDTEFGVLFSMRVSFRVSWRSKRGLSPIKVFESKQNNSLRRLTIRRRLGR